MTPILWVLGILILATVLIMAFKPDWAKAALGFLAVVSTALAAAGEKIMAMFGMTTDDATAIVAPLVQ